MKPTSRGSGAEISGMLTFIWNARKLLSQPVELFMQYVRLNISPPSRVSYPLITDRQRQTATNKQKTRPRI